MKSRFLITTLFAFFAAVNLTFGQNFCDQAQGTAGFPDDIACETAICAADAYCCDTEWDAICAAAAAIEPACAACLTSNAPVPNNDDACQPEALTLGVNSGYSSVNASAETGEVSPGAGTQGNTCQSQDGWCSFDADVQNSTWYTFNAPASGNVIVSTDGSGFDTQLAVYSAASCSNLTSGAATLIAANDDNPDYITTIFSSEVTLVCLTPGETYYVQVDGYDGASGDVVITLTDIGNFAGTLIADASSVCVGGTISATEDMAPEVPAGYSVLYVLTDADENLTVINAAATPSFSADSAGNFIIHTLVYDPAVLDPTIAIGVEALTVNSLLVQGGGAICAALDLNGAAVAVEGPMAGTLIADADTVCLVDSVTISATVDMAPEVPAGYSVLYVLTDADNNLTVVDASATPSFTVTSGGNYIIHTLVYDPNTLDPTVAIGLEALVVNSLLVQGGGAICAALDLNGAAVSVTGPMAGTLIADASSVCVGGTISATEDMAPEVPAGYSVLYVLTDADENLTVINAAATPSFSADSAGNFIIHTLVYDPAVLDPTIAIGVEALTVNSLLVQGGGAICAALDLNGAAVEVEECDCDATAGTLEADESIVCEGGTISATEVDAPFVPTGYSVLYVLTDADQNLTVIDAAAIPSFSADSVGNFIIHTLVYDPATLDPTIAIGLEAAVVNSLLIQGGGSICAALDLVGASVEVELCTSVEEQAVTEFMVYPNPSAGQVTVQFNANSTIDNLRVTDMTGRVVFSDDINLSGYVKRELNLNVATGTYLLTIIGEEVNENLRIQVR